MNPKNKKIKLYGAGNSGDRSFFILEKNKLFAPWFSMFLVGCGFRNIECYEADITGIIQKDNVVQHFKNKAYDIDLVFTSDRIILIVRTSQENYSNLVSAIQKIAEM